MREVTRISIFNAISNGNYLRFFADTQQLGELPRQPGGAYTEPAEELETTESGFVLTWVDPSQGILLQAFSQSPNLEERIEQGRVVGYVILGILGVGLLLSLERFGYLYWIGFRMGRQLKRPEEPGRNPLGRIIDTFRRYSDEKTDLETLELKLDEAIMKEIPPFERGLSTIKILAAVAPLLGLLGTVTGMIETFQSITLFGTGDPKLMAGGISQALVTTVLGLVAAIPLVLLHSLLQGKSERQIQLLEEQSAGLVAQYAEDQLQAGEKEE
jgi:biopolymer transport protein ExbB